MDLKETDILGDKIDAHWYYRSKAKAMTRMLGDAKNAKVLDVGSGSGFFSKYLLKNTDMQEAWCVDVSYDEETDESINDKPLYFRKSISSSNADIVLLMDVLEHVDDDIGLLNEYVTKTASGSRFLITVPAFPFMWSEHDVFLDHRRRYTVEHMEDVISKAGLKNLSGAYYFGAVFPLAAAIRLTKNAIFGMPENPRSQLKLHNPLINSTLAALSHAELPFMKFNRLAGLSVICLAEKP